MPIKQGVAFESNGLLWTVEVSQHPFGDRDWIAYAMCPTKRCRTKIDFSGDLTATCTSCGRQFTIPKPYEALRGDVNKKYGGSKFWDAQVTNLDLLPTSVSAREEDPNYWVQVKLGQKDGKRMAVVYIGDKTDEGEKAQLFVDVDDEQMRFDKSDKHPMNVVTELVAYFPGSTHTVKKRED